MTAVMAAEGEPMRPFFSYFGAKWTLAKHYPAPEHDLIVEPFAGSAGYATRFGADRDVLLVEKAPEIAAMWRWLIGVSVDEILGLPLDVSLRESLPEPARTLVGFWCARGRTRPANTHQSSWLRDGRWPTSFWGEHIRARIAQQVQCIRHWRVLEGDYAFAPDAEATWFIDPPYVGSRHYTARVDDYAALGAWCRERRGLVVVCEQEGADWLPFAPFREAKSISRGSYREVAYVQRSAKELQLAWSNEEPNLSLGPPQKAPRSWIVTADCIEYLRALPSDSVDAMVSDPPYGLSEEPDIAEVLRHWLAGDAYEHKGRGFMGKSWDSFVPGPEYWREVYRVLKPGAHALAFSSTRTDDLLSIAMRFAGFERRDEIGVGLGDKLAWLYGSGFPKSLNVGREIDMELCALPGRHYDKNLPEGDKAREGDHLCPQHPAGDAWRDTGSALKPGWEPILVFRKPLGDSMARCVLRHGTGGLEIGAARLATGESLNGGAYTGGERRRDNYSPTDTDAETSLTRLKRGIGEFEQPPGRWPPNVALVHLESCELAGERSVAANGSIAPHTRSARTADNRTVYNGGAGPRGEWQPHGCGDGTETIEDWRCAPGCPVVALDAQSGVKTSHSAPQRSAASGEGWGMGQSGAEHDDRGGASRFFYCAKPRRGEKDAGLESLAAMTGGEATDREDGSVGLDNPRAGAGRKGGARNPAVTVKPIDLMRWLVRLATPPGGVVLDPFCGSGTTGCAAALEGFDFIGVEQDEQYAKAARLRIAHWRKQAGIQEEEVQVAPIENVEGVANLIFEETEAEDELTLRQKRKTQNTREIHMSEDVTAQVAGLISSSKVFGGSDNIRHGKYKLLIERIFSQNVEADAGNHRMSFWEFRVLKAEPNPQIEGDRVDYIGPQQTGTGPLKDDGTNPNAEGSRCGLKVDFDGPGGRSAGSNIKAAILGLFGKRDGEIPDAEINKTWIDLAREKDVAVGDPIGIDPNTKQVITAQVAKRANPACGAIIYCETMPKKKRTPNDKGAYVTKLIWSCGGSPWGIGENAPELVAQRRAEIEARRAVEDEDEAEERAATPAAPQGASNPFGAGAHQPAAPPPPAGNGQNGHAVAPPSPTPPVPPAPSAPPPPAPTATFAPPSPWEIHPEAQHRSATDPSKNWFWSNPAKGGSNQLKSEAQFKAGL